MPDSSFGGVFNKLKIPVIVCAGEDGLPVVYMNGSARLIFAPGLSIEQMHGQRDIGKLEEVLRFDRREEYREFAHSLTGKGAVEDMSADVLSYQDDIVSAVVNANAGEAEGKTHYFIYIADTPSGGRRAARRFTSGEYMARILQASHNILNLDDAIQAVLNLAGVYADVSRAYIFEDIPGNATRNTYEWCAEGVEPAIDRLQRLEKKDYNYDAIMNAAGMVITDDTGQLPEGDREILQSQGIKAIAILPLFHFDDPLGYMGFDDCASNRQWTLEEIQFLESVASVVSSLVNRRNAERESRRSREIVQTVADNLDDLVYISDLKTYELKFISKSLAKAVRMKPEEILGRQCWEILHRGQGGPCSFCPIPRLLERDAAEKPGPYVWELHSGMTGKWYLVKDNLIDWLGGERAHLGTYVDITYRKQYEEQLKRFASIDAMTDVFNRKWGYDKILELFREPPELREQKTLCFIDLDDLKSVNDRHGHAAGDELIVNAIRTIYACVRKNDFVCRWGGDEFILFLNCGMRDAEKVLEKIRFGLEHFNRTGGKPYTLSVSCGLVDFATPAGTLDQLIDEADRRMYEDKMRKRANSANAGLV